MPESALKTKSICNNTESYVSPTEMSSNIKHGLNPDRKRESELFEVEIQEAYQLLARTVDELVAKFGRAQ